MDFQVKAAIEKLMANGIKVSVDPSNSVADVYILKLPNGDQYECLAAGLIKLTSGTPSIEDVKSVGKKI